MYATVLEKFPSQINKITINKARLVESFIWKEHIRKKCLKNKPFLRKLKMGIYIWCMRHNGYAHMKFLSS